MNLRGDGEGLYSCRAWLSILRSGCETHGCNVEDTYQGSPTTPEIESDTLDTETPIADKTGPSSQHAELSCIERG